MKRVLAVLIAIVLGTSTFVVAAAAGVVLHLGTEATRRLAAQQATRAMVGALEGTLTVEHIGGMSLRGVEGVRACLRDVDGTEVLLVDGARVRLRALAALRSAFFGERGGPRAPIDVRVEVASVDHVDALLDPAPGGRQLRLARALGTPRPRAAGVPEPKREPPGPVRLEVSRLALAHAWAHGAPPGAPPLDVELGDLRGAVRVDGGAVRADLDQVEIAMRGLPRQLDTRGMLAGRVEASPSGQRLVEGAFHGSVARVPTALTARMEGRRLDARLDVARATADELRAVLGVALSPRAAAELRAELHGEWPRLEAVARLRGAGASLDTSGTITLGEGREPTRVRARLSARDLDASAIAPRAPRTRLGLDGRADVELRHGAPPVVELAVDSLPGTVLEEAVPPARLRAGMSGDFAWASLSVRSEAVPAEIDLALAPVDGKQVLDAQLNLEVPELARAPVIGRQVHGSVRAHADGRLDLATRALEVRADVLGSHLERGGDRVESLSLRGTATGTPARVDVDAELGASLVRLGRLGTLDRVSANARVDVERGAELVLRDARLEAVRGAQSVTGKASRLELGGAHLRLVDAEVRGLGQPLRAQVERTPRELHAVVDAPAIDAARLARVFGREDVGGGMLSVRGDVTTTRDDLRGELHASLHDLAVGPLARGGASLDATLRDGAASISLEAALGDVARLVVRSENLVLGGAALAPDAWKRATGRLRLDGDVSLTKLAATMPADALPLGELGGEIVVRGVAWKRKPEAPPRLELSAYSRGLLLAGRSAPERGIGATRVKGVAPWRSQDFDVEVDARVDSGADDNELAVRIHDGVGIVAALDAKAVVPMKEILLRPSVAAEALMSAPLSVKVVVPERPLSRMPSVLGAKNVGGSVEATIDVRGSALAPSVVLVARAREVRAAWLPLRLATDATLEGHYDGRTADLGLTLRAQDRDVMMASSRVQVAARDLLLAPEGALRWRADASVKLDGFPLESVGALAERRVEGRAAGEVVLEGLHEDARLRGELALAPLEVGAARYTRARVTFEAGHGRLDAGARVEQEGGWLDARATSGLSWGARLGLSLDRSRPFEARLRAHDFRVAALAPFVQGPLNDLDGRLEADARLALGPEVGRAEGLVALRDGRVQVTALGEELRDLRAKLTLRPDGSVLVEEVHARGSEGEIAASGLVRTAGLAFVSAEGKVAIPRRDPLSFALEGQPVGRVAGRARLEARAVPGEDRVEVRVDVPELHADVPQSMKSGLQQLAEPRHVRVGVYRRPGELVRLPLDKEDLGQEQGREPPTTIDVDVHLGEATIVRGNQARVIVSGNPRVTLADETKMSGQIQLVRGRIEVQGKEFEVERGTVTFRPEDTSNPVVVATASWTAGDGTKVFADFTGPLQTGKVNLRSEPPRPKNEILALILFGTTQGMNATPPPPGRAADGTTTAAVGIGGGLAARGLTEALDDLAGIQATARIDTSQGNNPRPELEIQIAKNIAVELGHVLGTPPITEPDKNLVTFDWRFARSWSLETTFGDRGRAMVDAVWQRRY